MQFGPWIDRKWPTEGMEIQLDEMGEKAGEKPMEQTMCGRCMQEMQQNGPNTMICKKCGAKIEVEK